MCGNEQKFNASFFQNLCSRVHEFISTNFTLWKTCSKVKCVEINSCTWLLEFIFVFVLGILKTVYICLYVYMYMCMCVSKCVCVHVYVCIVRRVETSNNLLGSVYKTTFISDKLLTSVFCNRDWVDFYHLGAPLKRLESEKLSKI